MYWQYGRAHYIRAHRLQCTATTPDGTLGRVDGGGSDDVGEFTLSGTYESLRLVLTKTYIAGTGDPRENKGHTVRLRLTLTDLHAVVPAVAAPPGTLGFFGTWHVRTSAYNGDAEMALWRDDLGIVDTGFDVCHRPLPVAHGLAVLPSTEQLRPLSNYPPRGAPVPIPAAGNMSALRQPLLGAAPRPNEEDRIDALRAAHPGKSTAELRAMART